MCGGWTSGATSGGWRSPSVPRRGDVRSRRSSPIRPAGAAGGCGRVPRQRGRHDATRSLARGCGECSRDQDSRPAQGVWLVGNSPLGHKITLFTSVRATRSAGGSGLDPPEVHRRVEDGRDLELANLTPDPAAAQRRAPRRVAVCVVPAWRDHVPRTGSRGSVPAHLPVSGCAPRSRRGAPVRGGGRWHGGTRWTTGHRRRGGRDPPGPTDPRQQRSDATRNPEAAEAR